LEYLVPFSFILVSRRRLLTFDLRSPAHQHGMEWCISQHPSTCGHIHSISAAGAYMVAAGPAGAVLLDARMGIVVQRWSMKGWLVWS
jgi:hypothetical protein